MNYKNLFGRGTTRLYIVIQIILHVYKAPLQCNTSYYWLYSIIPIIACCCNLDSVTDEKTLVLFLRHMTDRIMVDIKQPCTQWAAIIQNLKFHDGIPIQGS